MKQNRKEFIRSAALLGIGVTLQTDKAEAAITKVINKLEPEPFELPQLGYSFNALEPFIDGKTMEIHYDKHHRAYVNNLNNAVKATPQASGKKLEELFKEMDKYSTAIRNNAGGHWNHSFFWQLLKRNTQLQPQPKVMVAINHQFGSIESFKKAFETAAASVFGSGWAWLIKMDGSTELKIVTTPNQDNPLMNVSANKGKPIIGLDVWEHAYYLKHQNRRAEYLQDFWQILNWEQVEKNLS